MRLKLKLTITLLALLSLRAGAQDMVMNTLRDELGKQWEQLKGMPNPPYYMNLRIDTNINFYITATMGALMNSEGMEFSSLMSQIRLGDYQTDSYLGDMAYMQSLDTRPARLPFDPAESEAALREAIWRDVNARYKSSVDYYETTVKANRMRVQKEQDAAPNFTECEQNSHYEPAPDKKHLTIDRKAWEEKVRGYSAALLDNPDVVACEAELSYTVNRKYFVSTEGSDIAQNLYYCLLVINASVMADDGSTLELYKQYFAFTPDGLPPSGQVLKEIKEMGKKLSELRVAPLVESFTGPAMLSGAASGVFFHEIFGHRIEGQPMKSNSNGQTFKKLIGQPVLPAALSVYDDPSLQYYHGEPLNGYYLYDEQGVKGERVTVVEKGTLKGFLMTRSAIDVQNGTNGHARAQMGFDPTSRQSNLIVETSEQKSERDLRALLLAEIKNQGKEYGFYFKQVTGGLTQTSANNISSFEVTPLEVYRVYSDGRPDELVRGVDLVGTPLAMFSQIECTGNDYAVFTGMCGAESGSVPVTAIAPSLLVRMIEVQKKSKSQTAPPLLPKPAECE